MSTVGFYNFNLRVFNLRVSNPNKLIVHVFLTRCRISMCHGLGQTKNTMKFRKSTVLTLASPCFVINNDFFSISSITSIMLIMVCIGIVIITTINLTYYYYVCLYVYYRSPRSSGGEVLAASRPLLSACLLIMIRIMMMIMIMIIIIIVRIIVR